MYDLKVAEGTLRRVAQDAENQAKCAIDHALTAALAQLEGQLKAINTVSGSIIPGLVAAFTKDVTIPYEVKGSSMAEVKMGLAGYCNPNSSSVINVCDIPAGDYRLIMLIVRQQDAK